MKKLRLLSLAVVLLFSVSQLEIYGSQTREAAPKIRIDGNMADALRTLAGTYRVVIGFEEIAMSPDRVNIKVRLDGVSFPEALSAVMSADPRYSWRQEPTGATHVLTKGVDFGLPAVNLSDFTATHATLGEISNILSRTSEVKGWIAGRGCSRNDVIISTGIVPEDDYYLTINNRGKSLRDNLDEVALKARSYYWRVAEDHAQGRCYVSIDLPSAYVAPRHLN